MVYGRIKFPYIHLQAIFSSCFILEGSFNRSESPINTPSLYTGISITGKTGCQIRLNNQHYSPVNNPIGEIRKTKYLSLFRLSYCENIIGGRFISPIPQHCMKRQQILLLIFTMPYHPILPLLTLPGHHISRPQVIQTNDMIVQITPPFHLLCFQDIFVGHSPY